MYVESKTARYTLDPGETKEIFDIVRRLPYDSLKITVEPQAICDYEVTFYLGDHEVGSVVRSNDRQIEKYQFEELLPATCTNCNWVEQEQGTYTPGQKAKIIIKNNEILEKVVFLVIFSAVIESFVSV